MRERSGGSRWIFTPVKSGFHLLSKSQIHLKSVHNQLRGNVIVELIRWATVSFPNHKFRAYFLFCFQKIKQNANASSRVLALFYLFDFCAGDE